MAQALIAGGHRRLAMIAGRFVASDRSARRYAGFRQALADAHLDEIALIELGFDQPEPDPAIRRLLTGPDRPTGLFCSTDLLALRVIALLRTAGIMVPRDAAVVGFDGIAIGSLLAPSLATVIQPSYAMGRCAFDHLQARLDGAPVQQRLLPYELRPGGTLGVDLPPEGRE